MGKSKRFQKRLRNLRKINLAFRVVENLVQSATVTHSAFDFSAAGDRHKKN